MLSVATRSIVEFSFTSKQLVVDYQPAEPNLAECNHFHYDAWETPRSNLTRYHELVHRLVVALIQQYGEPEVGW